MPDARYGEELCAWVTLREGAPELTAEAVREFAAGKLAHYKIPRYVLVVDEFPMTVTGKVRKVEMREKTRGAARPEAATVAPSRSGGSRPQRSAATDRTAARTGGRAD